MTDLPFFQVDAFASAPFEGNPAAVIPLESWLARRYAAGDRGGE
jgi:predicted PhzF superfamily epimerase YddE/YHI9